MGRPLRRAELQAKKRALSDGYGARAGESWAQIHDRLRAEDVARDQYLREACAAEDAERAVRSAAWRANVERMKRQKLRRAAESQG